MGTPVLMLPGSVLPAALAYPGLVEAIGMSREVVFKELELYAGPQPPDGYTLDTEVAGIDQFADGRGWARFHLVGYSGGGVAVLAVGIGYRLVRGTRPATAS